MNHNFKKYKTTKLYTYKKITKIQSGISNFLLYDQILQTISITLNPVFQCIRNIMSLKKSNTFNISN